jgi:hypothetical protein
MPLPELLNKQVMHPALLRQLLEISDSTGRIYSHSMVLGGFEDIS